MTSITNQDLYNAINDFRKEITDMVEKQEERCVKRIDSITLKVEENTNWRNKVIGQFTIIMVFVGAGVNWIFGLFDKN